MEKWLHLGCGQRMLPGAVHIDMAEFPHIDFTHDIRELPMIGAATCDGLYASHCFEYFAPGEALAVLAEWKRVLKPGGLLRLAVPDFAALSALYQETGDISLVLGPLYGRWQPAAGRAAAPASDAREQADIFHKTAYDQKSLSRLLSNAGFREVRLWDWRKVFTGAWLNFDNYSQAYYPHLDKDKGRLLSLNLEGLA